MIINDYRLPSYHLAVIVDAYADYTICKRSLGG